MLTINVQGAAGEERINGSLNGNQFNIPYTEETYKEMQEFVDDLKTIEEITDFDLWTIEVQAVLDGSDSDDIITSACPDLMVDNKTGNYYLITATKVSDVPVPQKLVDVILESVEKNLDATPIIKAWARFLRNLNFSTNKAERFADYVTAIIVDGDEVERLIEEEGYTFEKAEARSTYNDVAITAEGLIVTKKYARLLTKGWVIDPETNQPVLEDLFKATKTVDQFSGKVTTDVAMPEFAEDLTFEPPVQGRSGDAFLCGEAKDHIIKVGMVHSLENWNQVNTNDFTNCVAGLHVGGWGYVSRYKSLNCQLLECFVDPSEIGAICDVSPDSDGALRVKEYFIYGAVEGRTKGIYHSSKYAAIKDTEWEAFKAEAVKVSADLSEAANNLD